MNKLHIQTIFINSQNSIILFYVYFITAVDFVFIFKKSNNIILLETVTVQCQTCNENINCGSVN